jgi:hypothetical protein
MDVLIITANATSSGFIVEATCNKVSALVSINSWGVTVVCQNAANRIWRGMGKTFTSAEKALAAYKSPEMKAIIHVAVGQASAAQAA